MKNSYVLLTFLFCFAFSSFVFSQNDRAKEAIQNAPYIFEGVVISLQPIQDENNQYHISYKIAVNKKLKGDAFLKENDTVELISALPDGWSISLPHGEILRSGVDHTPLFKQKGLGMSPKTHGVFFVKKNETSLSTSENNCSVVPYYINADALFRIRPYPYYDSLQEKEYNIHLITGFEKKFESMAAFNTYLKSQHLPALDNGETDKKKDVESPEESQQNENQYIKRLKKSKEYQRILNERRNKAESSSGTSKSVETITFEIYNEEITGSGTQYYEFDIFVSGNSSNTYLDNAAFVLEFNTLAFGINLSANNKVTITRGANYNTPTYIDPMDYITDDAPNAIRFGIGSDYSATSWNRPPLTPTPERLLHLKIELSGCTGYSGITFTDIANVSFVDLYTTNPTIDPSIAPYLAYDSPDYVQPTPFQLCPPPVIDAFSPAVISTGTKSTLTITGYGFGNSRGNGQVQFKNADNGGATIIPYLNSIDYISWADSEIKIILPYNVDSLDSLHPIGSGIFTVKRADGLSASSSFPLTVNYAVRNSSASVPGSSSFRKIPYRQVSFSNYSNGHAREFSLDTSITNNPSMVVLVYKSLQDWSCATSINWVVVDTVRQQGFVQDGKSVIFLDNSLGSLGGLGKTQLFNGIICSDSLTGEEFIYWREADIAFARDFPSGKSWFFDTTMSLSIPNNQYDFYSTAQHELGHAHYLGHVVSNTDIMFYGEPPGPIPASNRLYLYTSTGAMEGGIFITSESYLLNLGDCYSLVSPQPLYLDKCGTLGLESISVAQNKMIVFPNPFSDKIEIKLTSENTSEVSLSIYDVSGRLISEYNWEKISHGSDTKTLDLHYLNSGIYIVGIRELNNKTHTVKIIKQ